MTDELSKAINQIQRHGDAGVAEAIKELFGEQLFPELVNAVRRDMTYLIDTPASCLYCRQKRLGADRFIAHRTYCTGYALLKKLGGDNFGIQLDILPTAKAEGFQNRTLNF